MTLPTKTDTFAMLTEVLKKKKKKKKKNLDSDFSSLANKLLQLYNLPRIFLRLLLCTN